MTYCPKCGSQMGAGWSFCRMCGAPDVGQGAALGQPPAPGAANPPPSSSLGPVLGVAPLPVPTPTSAPPPAPPPPPPPTSGVSWGIAGGQLDEAPIGKWEKPFVKKGEGVKAVGIMLIFIGFMIMFAVVIDISFLVFGLILVLIGAYLGLRHRPPQPHTWYVLTTRRAFVDYCSENGTEQILESCDLARATVTLLNRSYKSESFTTGGAYGGAGGYATVSATTRGEGREIGDVVFFVDGVPAVRFAGVLDPDGILATVKIAMASLKRASPNAMPAAPAGGATPSFTSQMTSEPVPAVA